MRTIDEHFLTATDDRNAPLPMRLLGVWYTSFLGAQSKAVISYAHDLVRFPAYLQQLTMESLGKSVGLDGSAVGYSTGEIYWGEPGTNGQHAFFQLLHQGTHLIPVDFIGVARPVGGTMAADDRDAMHAMLMSNLFAQSRVLAFGQTEAELRAAGISAALAPQKAMPGNRPSTTILAPALTPGALGQLIALYEHIVFVHAAIWNPDEARPRSTSSPFTRPHCRWRRCRRVTGTSTTESRGEAHSEGSLHRPDLDVAEPVPVRGRGGGERSDEVLPERHRTPEAALGGNRIDGQRGGLQQLPRVIEPPREHPPARTCARDLEEPAGEAPATHVRPTRELVHRQIRVEVAERPFDDLADLAAVLFDRQGSLNVLGLIPLAVGCHHDVPGHLGCRCGPQVPAHDVETGIERGRRARGGDHVPVVDVQVRGPDLYLGIPKGELVSPAPVGHHRSPVEHAAADDGVRTQTESRDIPAASVNVTDEGEQLRVRHG